MAPLIRPYTPTDTDWAKTLLTAHFGSPKVVSRGTLHDATTLPGFVAEADKTPVGLITYNITDTQCEVVTITGPGVGAYLLAATVEHARNQGCHRLWLITTNDNTHALTFYQRQGWDLSALHKNAVTEARKLKPEIPRTGENNIPIRHELELEFLLHS
ncbi:GNAT family N-acetyltransferase [Sphaerisporangium aureirubrum]|uniref:GNAT family N-acetyltransferase n=1 Tax=Sphaerisporangium aureirubrum TaxID=1544736 RepID=A0ABW1NCP2_9ACTN